MSRTQFLALIFIVATVCFIAVLQPPAKIDAAVASTLRAPVQNKPSSAIVAAARGNNFNDNTSVTPALLQSNYPQATTVISLAQLVGEIKQADKLQAEKLIDLMQVNINLSQEIASAFQEKSPDSIEVELAASASFEKFKQKNQQFKQLQLETLQCNIDICLLSIAGLELLTPDSRGQLEEAILSDKDSGLIQKVPKGSGGSAGEFITHDGHFYRVVYPINPRFEQQGL